MNSRDMLAIPDGYVYINVCDDSDVNINGMHAYVNSCSVNKINRPLPQCVVIICGVK